MYSKSMDVFTHAHVRVHIHEQEYVYVCAYSCMLHVFGYDEHLSKPSILTIFLHYNHIKHSLYNLNKHAL